MAVAAVRITISRLALEMEKGRDTGPAHGGGIIGFWYIGGMSEPNFFAFAFSFTGRQVLIGVAALALMAVLLVWLFKRKNDP